MSHVSKSGCWRNPIAPMSSTVYDLLKQLDIIGSICQNDKLCTQKGVVDVYRPSSIRGLQRWWTGENRSVNLQQVRLIVDRSCDTATMLLERLRNARDATTSIDGALVFMDRAGLVQVCNSLLEALKRSVGGLQNLVETYKDDYVTSAEIRLMADQVTLFAQRAGASDLLPPRPSSRAVCDETTKAENGGLSSSSQ